MRPRQTPALIVRRLAPLGLCLLAAIGGSWPLPAAEVRQAGEAGKPDATNPETLAEGERLALHHCGRCHVVNEKNRFGGIGSTPSFAALRALPNASDRFAAFWTLNPHPAFVQVKGQTTPFDPAHPPSAAPVILTQHEAEAIAVYAASIEPLDLGAPVGPR
jgi:mono/diheme cytochrome c family protein